MIKFTGVVENTSVNSELKNKHGLCIYIETDKHKILFDLGMTDLFARNAEKLGINISEVDTLIISHGHSDHGGALKQFLATNKTAKIYVRKDAFEKHYIKVAGIPFSVSLDSSLMNNGQIVFTSEHQRIDEELTLYSNVTAKRLCSKANNKLYGKYDGKILKDRFEHEQYLVITVEGKDYLITGCSHNGIVNIVDTYKSLSPDRNSELEMVIGGFHLFNPTTKKFEPKVLISEIANELNKYDCRFYTCHCTGGKAFSIMKETMKDHLGYLAVGTVIED